MSPTLILITFLLAGPVAEDQEPLDFFEKRIRPVLVERCTSCHGPRKQKAGLRVDHISTLLRGGDRGPEIVPGAPDKSRLIQAVRYDDVNLQMPPRERLSAAVVRDLERWVAAGAPWPDEAPPDSDSAPDFDLESRRAKHWAWQPLTHATPPPLPAELSARDPLDHFVLAQLLERGLVPAGDADRRTWLRRVSFDLIGLPPLPEEVDAFLADSAPDAHERVVDRLLASPHFGERWGRHWLDLMRYAETYGHEFDYPIPEAWRYRDYVIRALNADVPYDDFVTEHIAGDLLEKPRRHPQEGFNESIIGTGFWWLHQATHAPVDVRADEAERVDNQIDVFSKAFLGLTVACARCHDHKFDAISAADYYALAGFLKSSRRQLAFLDPGRRLDERALQLAELQEEVAELFEGEFPVSHSIATEVDVHLRASREAMLGTPHTDDDPALLPRPDQVFEDFEDGTFDRWTVEGEAFAKGPVTGTLRQQHPVEGFTGNFLLNSYVDRDGPQGRMVSAPFPVERRFIRFLIGGGNHPGKTALNLLVRDEVVRNATGRNAERLLPYHWDVSELRGEEAQLEIVDRVSGGWGHLNLDEIVFADRLTPLVVRRPIPTVAAEFGVKAVQLERWLDALQESPAEDLSHPLHPWLRASRESWSTENEKLLGQLEELARRQREFRESATIFEEFTGATYSDWTVTGHAFGAGSTGPDAIRLDDDVPSIEPAGVAHSGMTSPKLQGALRCRDFTIEKKWIHFRAWGHGGRIRIIVDGYFMDVYNALLFEGHIIDVDSGDEPAWHSLDLSQYHGHRAHVEILDDGDGWLAVDEILLSDDKRPGATSEPGRTVLRGASAEPDAMARAYGSAFDAALRRRAEGTASVEDTRLINWALHRDLLAGEIRLAGRRRQLAARSDALDVPRPLRALAMTDGSPQDEFVFIRGDHRSHGPSAPRRFLTALGAGPAPPGDPGSGRRELARLVFAPDNPLPSRVWANRIWQHLLGRGIVATPDDFGAPGARPTHPALLDHLAGSLADDDWSTKRLIRRIVLSSTYRRSSAGDPASDALDPDNRWWHRMSVRRLEGEAIRDAILAVSGRLDRKLYGPPVPMALTPFLQGRGRPGRSGPVDGAGRRSIYQEIRRNFLSPTQLAFDMPVPFSTTGRRSVSNVPAQALILMNSPLVKEQSAVWATRVLETGDSDPDSRIAKMMGRALSRTVSARENERLRAFLVQQAAQRELGDGDWAGSVDLWSDVAQVIFNLKEFIYVR